MEVFANAHFVGVCVFGLLVALIFFKIRPVVAFVSTASLLFVFNTITQTQFLVGFTNSSLVTLLLLIFCSFAVEKTVYIKKLGLRLFSGTFKKSYIKLLLGSSLVSSVTNNTAVVATLMSSIKQYAPNRASKLLLPLSYASIVGGTLTLVGTSTNLIVAGFVEEAQLTPLTMLSTTLIGFCVLITCLLTLLVTTQLLPEKASEVSDPKNAYFLEAKVSARSGLIGKTVVENGFRDLGTLFLSEIIRDGHLISPVSPNEILQSSDRLLFSGDIHDVTGLTKFDGLEIVGESLTETNLNLVEVVVLHDSILCGKSIKTAKFRSLFNASVVGVRRGDTKISGGLGNVVLSAGDALLLAVGTDFKDRKNLKRNFVILNDDFSNGTLSKRTSNWVLTSFLTVIALSVFELIPLLKGMLILSGVYIATGILSIREIRRRIPFDIALIIGSALAIAHAMMSSGLALKVSELIIELTSGLGILGAFVGIFITTLILTELITNNAAAALVFPVAISVAQSFGADPMPFVMAVAFGASASFISPFGYQTNLMVFSAGRYKIADYVKLGLPVSLVYSATALIVIPLVYQF